jgi:hypothetical protein
MTFSFRPSEPDDRNFIVDSWVRSYQFAHAAGVIATERWFPVMIPEVERLLDRPGSRTVVAYKTDEPDRLADLQGFITVDTDDETWGIPVIHYVFVKEFYRKSGRARGLFAAAGVDPKRPFIYTATTGVVSRIYHERKIPFARWDPLVARFAKDDPRRPRRGR